MGLKDYCLAWYEYKNDHRGCPITYQSNIISQNRGGCSRCLREENLDGVRCEDGWLVCPECYPAHCNVYQDREPELKEAKIGQIKWVSV